MKNDNQFVQIFMLTAALAVGCLIAGCSNRETILDVNTPDSGVQVERNTDTGEISIDVID